MGRVWRAHYTAIKRNDALKVVPDAFAADPERLARFGREAQILASLNHPNIAIIHSLQDAAGVKRSPSRGRRSALPSPMNLCQSMSHCRSQDRFPTTPG